MSPYAINLQNYKGGTWAFPDWRTKLPQRMCKQIKLLLAKLRNGDTTAKHSLIESHYRLAIGLAGKAAHRDQERIAHIAPEDLLAAAMLGLIIAVEQVKPTACRDGIASYAADYIAGKIRDEIEKRPNGTLFSDLEIDAEILDETENLIDPHAKLALDQVEQFEIIHKICNRPHDRDILYGRYAGQSFGRIAKEIGVPESTVRDRYAKLLRELAEALDLRPLESKAA